MIVALVILGILHSINALYNGFVVTAYEVYLWGRLNGKSS
jgi:hypothetical protein